MISVQMWRLDGRYPAVTMFQMRLIARPNAVGGWRGVFKAVAGNICRRSASSTRASHDNANRKLVTLVSYDATAAMRDGSRYQIVVIPYVPASNILIFLKYICFKLHISIA